MGSRARLLTQRAARGPGWLLRRLLACRRGRALAKVLAPKKSHCRVALMSDAACLARLYGYDRMPELEDPVATAQKDIEGLAGRGHMLVADTGQAIAGAVTLVHSEGEGESLFRGWWLFGLIVGLRHRGRGVGEGLMRAALGKAAEVGGTRVNLLVFADNRPAVDLYRKLGFELASIAGLDEQLEDEARASRRRRVIMSRAAHMVEAE